MSIMLILMVTIIAFIFIKTFIKYPLSTSEPSERGMHNENTPSSGGLAILGSYIVITLYPYLSHSHNLTLSSPIISLTLISIIGYADDKLKLTKTFRFILQALISLIVILSSSDLSLLESILWLAFFLYFINIYNFMDGIDGIATSQAIFVLFSLSMLNNFYPIGSIILFIIPLIIFLFYNTSPSKIFLGNAGSYLIGMLISILIFKSTLLFNNENYISHIFSILILLTIFIGDASYTLLARFFYKFKLSKNILVSLKHITTPHNLHNYQILAKKYHNHNKVNLYLMLYNILWCFPLAYLSQIFPNFALLFIIFSYVPYLIYCYKNNTGKD